jgi:hypothetical protein
MFSQREHSIGNMGLILVDRYHPYQRRQLQAMIDAGRLHKCDEVELLELDQLKPLARLLLHLLLMSSVFFVALDLASYYWQTHTFSLNLTFWSVAGWVGINIVSYVLVMLLHELVHALFFLFWGGRPYFGAKLPLALYCGAKNQLFHRNHYLVVGLAPLVLITLVGIVVTIIAPVQASYVLFALVGNSAGAAGDLEVAARVLKLKDGIILVEDTESGYRAWCIETEPLHVSSQIKMLPKGG